MAISVTVGAGEAVICAIGNAIEAFVELAVGFSFDADCVAVAVCEAIRCAVRNAIKAFVKLAVGSSLDVDCMAIAVCEAVGCAVGDAIEAVVEVVLAVIVVSGLGIDADAFDVAGTLSTFAVGFDDDANGFADAGAGVFAGVFAGAGAGVFCPVCARFHDSTFKLSEVAESCTDGAGAGVFCPVCERFRNFQELERGLRDAPEFVIVEFVPSFSSSIQEGRI